MFFFPTKIEKKKKPKQLKTRHNVTLHVFHGPIMISHECNIPIELKKSTQLKPKAWCNLLGNAHVLTLESVSILTSSAD